MNIIVRTGVPINKKIRKTVKTIEPAAMAACKRIFISLVCSAPNHFRLYLFFTKTHNHESTSSRHYSLFY